MDYDLAEDIRNWNKKHKAAYDWSSNPDLEPKYPKWLKTTSDEEQS